MSRQIHPSQFSKELVHPIAQAVVNALADRKVEGGTFYMIDPCAGLGWRLSEIADHVGLMWMSEAATMNTYPRKLEWRGMEIEPAYVDQAHPNVARGDSSVMIDWLSNSWDVGVTSPTYGNGMNDYFEAKDASRRNTYIHRIREFIPDYRLSVNNTARYSYRGGSKKWAKYLDLHRRIYGQMARVLKPGAPFIVNTKGFISGREMVDLTNVHDELLRENGFRTGVRKRVVTPGLAQGSNWEAREVYESVVTYWNRERDAS